MSTKGESDFGQTTSVDFKND